ncbi:Protein of unknown function, partial [Gryllus bimaculatus]
MARQEINGRTYRIFFDGRDVTPLPLACSTPDDHIDKENDGKESVSSYPSDQISELQENKLSSSPESISSDTSSSSRFRQSLTSPRDLGYIEMPYSEDVMEKFHGRFRTPSPKEEIIPLKITQERLLELLETKPLHPAKIILSLRETQTFFLLDRPSLTALEGSEEAELIKKDNAQYDYLTVGEGRHRYKKNAETQTKWKVWKSKGVWAPAAETQTNIAEASTYDLYQSFTDVHE